MPITPRPHWLAATLASLALLLVPAAAMADTSVVGWGSTPPIGLGGEQFTYVPPTTLPAVQNATAAALNESSSYLLTPSGVLVAGYGSNLGLAGVSLDPNELDPPLPFTLIPGTAGAKAVATGRATLILKADGTVDGFGGNGYGEAGGTPGTAIETPTPIAGLTDVTAVAAAGYFSSVALEGDGTVWAWGNHAYLGSTAAAAGPDTGTPTQVTLPADNPATAIAVGGGHGLVLLQDGSVWAWGYNERGQVGNGTTEDVTVPVQVIPPAGPGDPTVTAVSAGSQSSFALYSDGTYKGWGEGYFGQLGLGLGATANEPGITVPTSPDPAAVTAHPAAYPPLRQIVSTRATTYGIVAGSGQVLVWGDNTIGAFGFGENPSAYTYAWPYDPANPDAPGTSGQGATEIPQRLGRLKDVPWLGVGPLASSEIAATGSVLRAETASSGPAFFSHPVGTLSAAQAEVFASVDEPTTVTSIRITGPAAGDFSIDDAFISSAVPTGTPYSLPLVVPAGYFNVLVRFHPSAPGDRIATLKVSGQGETSSIQLTGYGTELPGNTPGAAGKNGVGLIGPPGPAGPAGKDGVIVFAATRAKVSAKRGGTASLSFLLVNGTSAKLDGATVHTAVPKTLGAADAGAIGIPSLRAGASRQVKIPLKIADRAKLGTQSVKVAFKAGAKTVTRTVSVRVTD